MSSHNITLDMGKFTPKHRDLSDTIKASWFNEANY